MVPMTIKKEELKRQLWPIMFDDTLVFQFDFLGMEGLFGVRNSQLRFIPMELIAEDIVISVPENLEEVMGYVATAEYIIQRILMTPHVEIIGLPSKDAEIMTEGDTRKEALTVLHGVLDHYKRNKNNLEWIENGWD